MLKTAVQFGAGNIGRGFLGQLFHESGLEVVFVDVISPVVETLNRQKSYTIEIIGENSQTISISNIRAVLGQNLAQVTEEVANAEIVCTAVGANVLIKVAPAIAIGLKIRNQQSGKPLNILLCENLHSAGEVLRDEIASYLTPEEQTEILPKTGFVQAVVSRMVPVL